jgi:WD40 repeat protein
VLTALLRAPAAVGVMRGGGDPLLSIDVSPDGRTVAAGDNHGTLYFLDALRRRLIAKRRYRPIGLGLPVGAPVTVPAAISAVRFSPDGARLAVAIRGPDITGIDLVDAQSHRSIRAFSCRGCPGIAFGLPRLRGLRFTPNSRILVAAGATPRPDASAIWRMDARTGRALGRPSPQLLLGTTAPVLAGFVVQGVLVTSSARDDSTEIRDAATLRPVRRFAGGSDTATVSPDGRFAALDGGDGSLRLLDLRTGRLRAATAQRTGAVSAVRFTPDSRTLLTGGSDGVLTVWNVRSAARVETLAGHTGAIEQIAVAPDGQTAYTAGHDGLAIAWDLSGRRRFAQTVQLRPPGGVLSGAVSAAGGRLAVGDQDGYVDIYDARSLREITRIRIDPRRPVVAVAISRDGHTIAAATDEPNVRFADVRTSMARGPPHRFVHAATPLALTFSADGRWLASGGRDHALVVWNVRRQQIANERYSSGIIADIAISADGRQLAATVRHEDGSRAITRLSVPGLGDRKTIAGRWAAYSPDGHSLYYDDDADRVWPLDPRTWRSAGVPWGIASGADDAVLSPDGRTLATVAADGTTRLIDLHSGRQIGPGLAGSGRPAVAVFLAGADRLLTLSPDGRGKLWDLRPTFWVDRACAIAGRTLTRAEWQDALPERPYAPACRP